MSRPSLALVVLVLALSAVAVAGAVAQEGANSTTPVVSTTPGEPNHLAINDSEVRRSNTTSLDLDVGSAVSADSSSLQTSYLRRQFAAAYANASTDDVRRQVVRRFQERFANRTAALEARDRQNIEAYANGAVTADQFLRERARIQARATQLQEAASEISDSIPSRIELDFRSVEGRLEVVRGPISAAALRDIGRVGEGNPIYAEVSDSAYSLASISNGEYTRETYLLGARYPQRPDQFANGTGGISGPVDRVLELYPFIRGEGGTTEGVVRFGPGIYRITMSFPGGEKRVYLSGGTTEVFREHQTQALGSFNTTQVVNRTERSVRLTVNRTFETGPAEIRLYDTTANAPVNGTVAIGNRDPVWVGDDGRLWIVEPRGEVPLNATVGTTRFTTTLSGS